LAKFLSDDYFDQLQTLLTSDQKWVESTKGLKTSIGFNVTDIGQNYILTVEAGISKLQKVQPGTQAEFAFDGTYESWAKIAKGDVDLQSAVLKGQLRFKGSITKILMYRERFVRVADLMKQVQIEF
jgi:putative sterol carrier protein